MASELNTAAALAAASDIAANDDANGDGANAAAGNAAAAVPALAPGQRRSEIFDAITGIVAEALGVAVAAVQPGTSFAELGLDSRCAARLSSRISEHLGLVAGQELPPTLVFDCPSVDKLVDHLLARGTPPDSSSSSSKTLGGVHEPRGVSQMPSLSAVSTACRIPGAERLEQGLGGLWDLLRLRKDAVIEVPLLRWDHSEYYEPAAAPLLEDPSPAGQRAGSRTLIRHGGFVDGAHFFDAAFFSVAAAEAQVTDPQQRCLLTTAYECLSGVGYDRHVLHEAKMGVFCALSNHDWQTLAQLRMGAFTGTGVSGAIAANRVSYAFGLQGPSMTLDTACSSSLSAVNAACLHMRCSSCSEALVAGSEILHGPMALLVRSAAGMLSPTGRCLTFNATADGYVRSEGSGAALIAYTAHAEDKGYVSVGEIRGTVMNQDGKSATLTAPNGPSQAQVILQTLLDARARPAEVACSECHGTGTALGDPIEVGALRGVYGDASETGTCLLLGAGKSNHGHLEGVAGFAGLLKAFVCLQHGEVPPNLHFETLSPHIALEGSRLRIADASTAIPETGCLMGVSSFGFGGTNAHAFFASAMRRQPHRQVEARKIAFLFTGQGSQYLSMGKRLYQTDQVFQHAFDRCAHISRSHLQEDLLDVLLATDAAASDQLNRPSWSQTLIFCLEFALAEMWQARGVKPYAVLGHSVGEYVAAVVAGSLSLEDGLKIIIRRGQLLDSKCEPGIGVMTSVSASAEVVRAAIINAKLADDEVAVVAAVNGPRQTVVSGHRQAVAKVCAQVPERSQELIVIPHAMHSPLLAPILPELKQALESCELKEPTLVRFVSSITGTEVSSELTKPSYWISHDEARPILYMDGIQALGKLGCDTFVEVGPHPVLTNLGRQCLTNSDLTWLASMRRGQDELETVLVASRMLGTSGRALSVLHPVPLPWGPPLLHPLLGSCCERKSARQGTFVSRALMYNGPALQLFQQHRVFDEIVLPAASHILLAAAAQLSLTPGHLVELTEIAFERPFAVPESGGVLVLCNAGPEGTEICSSAGLDTNVVHARFGSSRVLDSPESHHSEVVAALQAQCAEPQPAAMQQFYAKLKERSLAYGPSFQVIQACAFHEKKAVALLAPETAAWEQSSQFLHPALLDGALQLLVQCGSEQDAGTYLPFAVRRAVVSAQRPPGSLWAVVTVRDRSERSVAGNVEVFSESGQLVVLLEEVRCRRAGTSGMDLCMPAALLAASDDHSLYSLDWIPTATSDDKVAASNAEVPVANRVLVVAGAEDTSLLTSIDGVICVSKVSTAVHMLAQHQWAAIAYVVSAGTPQLEALDGALQLVQSLLVCAQRMPRLTLVTCDAQSPEPASGLDSTHDPEHAGLWGFARAVRLEAPSLEIHCVDLDSNSWSTQAGLPQIVKGLRHEEAEVAVRHERMLTSRVVRSRVSPQHALQLQLTQRGSLQNLQAVSQTLRRSPGADEVEVRVSAIGLNFRDVLNVLDLYPDDPGDPGMDCSGVVVTTDAEAEPGMTHCLGRAVFGIIWGCLRTYALAKKQLVIPRPESWSAAAAAALPTVYTTVDLCLSELAGLKAGERILVHAATGGVGLAAVQLAQQRGAIVYATAGSEEKHQHLQQLGVDVIASSRDGQAFETKMRTALGGQQFDVVLNSLSHDDFIGRSLQFLRKGGQFVEIGKRGIWTREQMKLARPDASYHVVAIDAMVKQQPEKYRELLLRLGEVMQAGLTPLPAKVFEGFEQAVAAFQLLQRAQHIGKVVISVPRRIDLRPSAAYLISGGLGSLGLVTAQFLVEEGASSLVLVSRSGTASTEMRARWKILESSCAEILPRKCDVSQADAVKELMESLKLTLPKSICGLLHLAGILDDALLPSLTRGHFERAFDPKVAGARNLHAALKGSPLELLVLYSSTAALLGAAGQANYAAANACLDALANSWRSNGEAALSIQWGPWLSVGMAAQKDAFSALKLRGISNELAMSALAAGIAARPPPSCVGCALVEWPRYLKQYQKVPSYLSRFDTGRPEHHQADTASESGATPVVMTQERAMSRAGAVAGEVIGNEVDADEPLMDAGLDSLSSVEFRNRIMMDFSGVAFPTTLAFDYPTLRAVTAYIMAQVAQRADQELGKSAEPAQPSKMQSSSIPLDRQVSPTSPILVDDRRKDNISILGMSARFPGCSSNSMEEYFTMLSRGCDTITEIPLQRWDVDMYYHSDKALDGKIYTRYGGFVRGLEGFDAKYFSISLQEATAMDAQQRLLLENVWESFWNAEFAKKDLMKSATGVFIGSATLSGIAVEDNQVNPYTNIGASIAGSSGRISHVFDLHGPCITVDTACSSTLVVVDLAAQSLQASRCQLACAAGSNVQLCPRSWVGFCKMTALSADGRCKTFDDRADGFTRSEGAGSLIFCKPEEATQKAKTSICGLAGSHVNSDGRSATIVAPSGPAQQRVITDALKYASAASTEISVIEVHGTGTPLGDVIEVGAIKPTLGKDRLEANPLIMAAVKTTVGHTEASAGAASLCKLVAAGKYKQVPKNLHLQKLNSKLDFSKVNVTLPNEMMEWSTLVRKAGTSSFGFSGTNSHVIVEMLPLEVAEGAVLEKKEPVPWNKRAFIVNDWAKRLWHKLEWKAETLPDDEEWPEKCCLIVGSGELVKALQTWAIGFSCEAVEASRFDTRREKPKPPSKSTLTEPKLTTVEGRDHSQDENSTALAENKDTKPLEQKPASTSEDPPANIEIALTDNAQPEPVRTGMQDQTDGIAMQEKEDTETVRADPEDQRSQNEGVEANDQQAVKMQDEGVIGQAEQPAPDLHTEIPHEKQGESRNAKLNDPADILLPAIREPASDNGTTDEQATLHRTSESDAETSARPPDLESIAARSDAAPEQLGESCTPGKPGELDPDSKATKEEVQSASESVAEASARLPDLESITVRSDAAPEQPSESCSPEKPGEVDPDSKATQEDAQVSGSEKNIEMESVDASGSEKKIEIASFDACVFIEPLFGDDPTLAGTTMLRLLHMVQEFMMANQKVRIVAATQGVHTPGPVSGIGRALLGAAVWGFLRSVRWESPNVLVQMVDFDHTADLRKKARCLMEELCAPPTGLENEVAYVDGVRHIPRVVSIAPPAPILSLPTPCSSYLVTGGCAGLGLLSARALANIGVGGLALVSRSGKPPAGDEAQAAMLEELQKSAATVCLWQCDVSDCNQVADLIARLEEQMPENPLRGVVHAAGVMNYMTMRTMTSEGMAGTFGPKVKGAWYLHEHTMCKRLDAFVVYSSISALLGLSRGSHYSAANSYLDCLVQWRREQGLSATSVQWGPVSEFGMGTAERGLSLPDAMKRVSPRQMQAALLQALSVASPLPGSLTFADVDWGQFLKDTRQSLPMFADLAKPTKEEAEKATATAKARGWAVHKAKSKPSAPSSAASATPSTQQESAPATSKSAGAQSVDRLNMLLSVTRNMRLGTPGSLMLGRPGLSVPAAKRRPERKLPSISSDPDSESSKEKTLSEILADSDSDTAAADTKLSRSDFARRAAARGSKEGGAMPEDSPPGATGAKQDRSSSHSASAPVADSDSSASSSDGAPTTDRAARLRKLRAKLQDAKKETSKEDTRRAELDAKRKAAEEALKAREMLNKDASPLSPPASASASRPMAKPKPKMFLPHGLGSFGMRMGAMPRRPPLKMSQQTHSSEDSESEPSRKKSLRKPTQASERVADLPKVGGDATTGADVDAAAGATADAAAVGASAIAAATAAASVAQNLDQTALASTSASNSAQRLESKSFTPAELAAAARSVLEVRVADLPKVGGDGTTGADVDAAAGATADAAAVGASAIAAATAAASDAQNLNQTALASTSASNSAQRLESKLFTPAELAAAARSVLSLTPDDLISSARMRSDASAPAPVSAADSEAGPGAPAAASRNAYRSSAQKKLENDAADDDDDDDSRNAYRSSAQKKRSGQVMRSGLPGMLPSHNLFSRAKPQITVPRMPRILQPAVVDPAAAHADAKSEADSDSDGLDDVVDRAERLRRLRAKLQSAPEAEVPRDGGPTSAARPTAAGDAAPTGAAEPSAECGPSTDAAQPPAAAPAVSELAAATPAAATLPAAASAEAAPAAAAAASAAAAPATAPAATASAEAAPAAAALAAAAPATAAFAEAASAEAASAASAPAEVAPATTAAAAETPAAAAAPSAETQPITVLAGDAAATAAAGPSADADADETGAAGAAPESGAASAAAGSDPARAGSESAKDSGPSSATAGTTTGKAKPESASCRQS